MEAAEKTKSYLYVTCDKAYLSRTPAGQKQGRAPKLDLVLLVLRTFGPELHVRESVTCAVTEILTVYRQFPRMYTRFK